MDENGETASIETSLEGLIWFADQIPQLVSDSLGERALGTKSALAPDRTAPEATPSLHLVTSFLLVGYEAGGRVVDLKTQNGTVFRFGLDQEIASQLSVALAPGGDGPPLDSLKN
jgi:hypothetical protein